MYARPNPSETDDDLLRLQEEFERNKAAKKIQPAAKLVRPSTSNVRKGNYSSLISCSHNRN